MKSIACIGAAHIDRLAQPKSEIVPGASNPVIMHRSIGGVACNVACALARFGRDVHLVSAVGQDEDGDLVLETANEMGVNVDAVLRVPDGITASYTALLDSDGELFVGMADMELYDVLGQRHLASVMRSMAPCAGWFIDTNLSPAALAFLTEWAGGTRIFACGVSPAKVTRLAPHLKALDCLFINRSEAEALAGRRLKSAACTLSAAAEFRSRGVNNVLITMGSEGVAISAEGVSMHVPAPVAATTDVTGAGDSFAAGLVDGLLDDMALPEAVRRGLDTAKLVVETAGAVVDSPLGRGAVAGLPGEET